MRKLTPDGHFVILLGLKILFHFALPVQRIIFHPYSLIGVIVIAIGVVTAHLVTFHILKNHTSINTYESPSKLITSGLFKYSRNPLYLGMAMALFGVDILLGTITPFIFTILFIISINKFCIPREEKNLENKFGEDYLAYKRRVRRWI